MNHVHSQDKIILGVDPGLYFTGYGLVDAFGVVVDYGLVTLPPSMSLAHKLGTIQEALGHLIKSHPVDTLVVETQYVALNPAAALKLGMVRGVVLATAYHYRLEAVEYSPSTIKKAVTSRGRASKEQVQHMIQLQLGLLETPPADAADALALALCHWRRKQQTCFFHQHRGGV